MSNTLGFQGSVGNTVADPGTFYKKQFEETLKNTLKFEDMGDKRPLPQNSGTQVTWTRPNKLVAVGTLPTVASYLLTENTNPSYATAGTTQISAIPKTYGNALQISAEVDVKSINPVLEGFVDELKEEAMAVDCAIIVAALSGNGTNQFAGGAVNEAAVADASILNAAELRKASYTLRKAGVPGFAGDMYTALVAFESAFDIMGDTATGGWLDVTKYTTKELAMRGEVGSLYGIRIVPAHLTGTGTGATATTYHNYVFGRKAFGIVPVSGRGMDLNIIPADKRDKADPLGRYAVASWQFMTAAKVIEAARFVQIYAGSAMA
jgi:N4-gp56 family major capsid protein